MRRLTNLALTRLTFMILHREYPIRTDVVFQPNKFQAYHYKPLSQFSFKVKIIYQLKKKYIPVNRKIIMYLINKIELLYIKDHPTNYKNN